MMLLHSQFLQPTKADYSFMDEVDPNQLDLMAHMGSFDFSSSLTTTEDSSDISSIPYFPTMLMPTCSSDAHFVLPQDEYLLALDELGHVSSGESFDNDMEDVSGWIRDNTGVPLQNQPTTEEGSVISMTKFSDVSLREMAFQSSVEDMEIDNEAGILHLLKAYGEAMEMGLTGLAQVILRRIGKKASPVGATVERMAHCLSQGIDQQPDYLNQESSKNKEMVFRALYEICPYGRFAHFTANMAIIGAIPEDAQVVHIVDFDMREGVQWPPLLEALGRRRMMRLTSVIRKVDQVSNPQMEFEVTKRRLCHYAGSRGLILKVEQREMEQVLVEKRKERRYGNSREWMAFNCMVGLPHMGRQRHGKHALEFIGAAKELINISSSNNSGNRGIITIGIGGGCGVEMRKAEECRFGSFFDVSLLHSHALFESIEWHFPPQLSLARTAIECLFVGPCVSSLACFSKWEEERQESFGMHLWQELEGERLSQENLIEAKEMVREGENHYDVKIRGERENEMILEWKATPLVRISVWS